MPTFDQLILHTERMILRPICRDDAESLFAMFSDPLVMRYWSTPPWNRLAQAHEMIERDCKAMALGEQLRLGMVDKQSGVLMGNCCLFNFSLQCRRAELGYGMHHPFWGKGLMHEALRALLRHAFLELDLIRLEADIDPRNGKSANSLERLGFIKEGHLRQRWIVNGEVSDTGLYGLLRSDWRE